MSEENKELKVAKTDEIDLIEVFRKVWDSRTFILKSVILFFLLGIIIVLGSPKEYKSEVILLVESSSSGSGMSALIQQFSGLTGLSGLGSATGKDALTPELYPDIIKSTPFLLDLLDISLTDSRYDSTLMLSEFLERHSRKSLERVVADNTIGLPFKLIRAIKGKPKVKKEKTTIKSEVHPFKLTSSQSRLSGELSGRINATEGESPNTLIIDAEMQDPQLAAQLVDSVVKRLTDFITDYRTQKAKTDLKFVEHSHHEAEQKYKDAQRALAAFKDRNMNIVTASGQIYEQNLQSDYTLAFNIYNTLSQQLEQAKLRVQEKTPVFKVMEPAKVPLRKDRPKTNLILIGMVFFGGFIGVMTILGKLIYQNFIHS